ncbi:hypothetical protein IWX49DRAFT_354239 [Phyllosticta citricarpa]|uniref:Uncharacterized protein n=1 Tax=Phyllosticta citricarpa TaxID=55181 RepID=A0ABR1L7L0_9PEZI
MQHHVAPPPNAQPALPVSGSGSDHSIVVKWKYELLPPVVPFRYPPGMRCTNLLRTIWLNFRNATYDYKASFGDIFEPGTQKDMKIVFMLERIRPSQIPGTTLAMRYGRKYPRAEWDRRNWYCLSYGQDMNAVATLTGPVARFLGPLGFKVDEVLVRVKDQAIFNQYSFKDGRGGNMVTANDIPNESILLLFKATHMTDPNRAYALAPTGPRFGWNWFALEWENFEANYTEDILRVRPLGTTRQVLDDQVLEDEEVEAHTMNVPERVIRQRQRRDARWHLRDELNRICDDRNCRMNPEQLVAILSYDEIGDTLTDRMKIWRYLWIKDLAVERSERRKAAVHLVCRKPWTFTKLFKFSVVPGVELPGQAKGENKARIDSASNPDDANAPAAVNDPVPAIPPPPPAPPAPASVPTTANPRFPRKPKILQNFNFSFKQRRWGIGRSPPYQTVADDEGPAGPQDQPLANQPAPLAQQGQQAQQYQQTEQAQQGQQPQIPALVDLFDYYGVTGGILDADPDAPPLPPPVVHPDPEQHPLVQVSTNDDLDREAEVANFREGYLEARKDLEDWYHNHADTKTDPDARWYLVPPYRPAAPDAETQEQEPYEHPALPLEPDDDNQPQDNPYDQQHEDALMFPEAAGGQAQDNNHAGQQYNHGVPGPVPPPTPPGEDEDAIMPAPAPPPPPPPPHDPIPVPQEVLHPANEPPMRPLWYLTPYNHWDPYIRHWYWYEISDEYQDMTLEGLVGPQTVWVDQNRLLHLELQPPP